MTRSPFPVLVYPSFSIVMTIIIHYSRLCQFLSENNIVPADNPTLIQQEELVPFSDDHRLSPKLTYFDLQLFVKNVKKQESWFSFLLRMVSFGYISSYMMCKSTRLLKQWEQDNSFLWDGSKRLIEIFSLELYVKERKLHCLEEENAQLQTKLSGIKRSQTTVLTALKEQCHRWDIVLIDISVLSKKSVMDSIKMKMSAALHVRLDLLANSVFEGNLGNCLSYAEKFIEETKRNSSNNDYSFSHIRKWLFPLQSQRFDPSLTIIQFHWLDILLDLCMLKGFLSRRMEESNEVDVLLPLSTINTMNVTKSTLQSYFTLIESLLTHFKSSWWNQLSSVFYESESTVIMENVERSNTLNTLQKQLEEQQIESSKSMQIAQNEYKIAKQAGRTY